MGVQPGPHFHPWRKVGSADMERGRESSSSICGDMGECLGRVDGWMDGWMDGIDPVILHREQGDRYVELSHAQMLPGIHGGDSGGDSEPESRRLNRDDFNLTKSGTRL